MKLLIVEDHIAFLEGLEEYLNRSLGTEWDIQTANSGKNALQKFNQGNHFDVLLTDLNLPGLNGTELIIEIKKRYPSIKVIILTMYYSRAIVSRLKEMGISAFLTKNVHREEILNTVLNINSIDLFVTEEIQGLFKDYNLENSGYEDENIDVFIRTFSLSKREIEVMDLVIENKSNVEIGEEIFISAETVKSHRKNIYRKMGINNVLDLYKLLLSKGYVEIT